MKSLVDKSVVRKIPYAVRMMYGESDGYRTVKSCRRRVVERIRVLLPKLDVSVRRAAYGEAMPLQIGDIPLLREKRSRNGECGHIRRRD